MGMAVPEVSTQLDPLIRNLFWHGKEMGVEAFQREQDYHRRLAQLGARLAIGCGVLCGLTVERHGSTGVVISPGAGLDGDGRLILVEREVTIEDLSRWICPDDDGQAQPGHYSLCLLHHECPIAPTPVLVTDCDTRMECRPGAVAERFRFEARPAERHRCEPLCPSDTHRCSCESACDDCVLIAWFNWDGGEVTDLWVEGRTEIPSLASLGTPHAATNEYLSPRLVDVWPAPGMSLSREGTPSEWGRWRYRPRIEFRFDQPIEVDRVDDAPDWLRAWVVSRSAPGPAAAVDSSLVVERINLRRLPEASVVTADSQREVFVFNPSATNAAFDHGSEGRGFAVIVQARATDGTGPAGAVVSRPAQMAYAGTALAPEQLQQLWSENVLPDDTTMDALLNPTPPACIGDGYEGGVLSMVFRIEPVGEDAVVTGLAPHNGARVRSGVIPPLEISSIADPRDLQPRAWLVPDQGGAPIPLGVGDGVGLPMGEVPRALDRFDSTFDASVETELLRTARFAIEPSDGLVSGRVLVIARATGAQNLHLGAFHGTCLTGAEAAEIYENGPTAAHQEHIRPSHERMPRAGRTGNWIHWTFAWEQDNVII